MRAAKHLVWILPLRLVVLVATMSWLTPEPVVAFAGVALYADPDRLELAPSGKNLSILKPDQPLVLELVSSKPLASLTLDLSKEAPAQIAVLGGEVGLRLFRPDGTILYQLMLDPGRPGRRWLIGPKTLHYSLTLTLTGAKAESVEVTITAEPVGTPSPPPANTKPRA